MKLSIITINLNNKSGLIKTMDSIFSQSFNDYEFIVIDGGSTDGSLEVIQSRQERISSWVSEKDSGIYNAMNKGVRMATGDYIGFMNSGDCYVENVLEKIFIKEPKSDILYGDQYFVREKGRLQLKRQSSELSLFNFYWGSLYHQSSFIKRKLFENDFYNEEYRIIADAEFFLKKIIFDKCSFQYLGLPVAYYDTEGLSSGSDAGNIIKEEREILHERFFLDSSLPDYKELKEYKKSLLAPFIPELNKTDRFQEIVVMVVKIMIRLYRFKKKRFKRS